MEGMVMATVELVQPAVKIFQGPIDALDKRLCRTIDLVEQQIPSIYLPPQLVIRMKQIIYASVVKKQFF